MIVLFQMEQLDYNIFFYSHFVTIHKHLISEQPGPVMDFKPAEITKDSVTLGWKKPVSNGGSHIVGYLLEISEGPEKWKQLMKSKLTQFTVGSLEEGKEYTFRVKAINESSEGPPTELTVLAKDQIGELSTL